MMCKIFCVLVTMGWIFVAVVAGDNQCSRGGFCMNTLAAEESYCDGQLYKDENCGSGVGFFYQICLIRCSNPLVCAPLRPDNLCCISNDSCSGEDRYCSRECIFESTTGKNGCTRTETCCQDPILTAKTRGMGVRTAWKLRYDERGINASDRAAEEDLVRAMTMLPEFSDAALYLKISKYLLYGIASRGSRLGMTLTPKGTIGDAWGVMQIDKTHVKVIDKGLGPRSHLNVLQGAKILKDLTYKVKKSFPRWTPEWQTRGAIAAYKYGLKDVQTRARPANNDYVDDVIARAQCFKKMGV